MFSNLSHLQTPPKFHWSIEDMASHFPVHIDQEEILRQSFCLSQTRYVFHLAVIKCIAVMIESG